MGSLYAIFFLVAMLLFAAIVGASWWQKQSKSDRLTLRGRRKHSESFDDVIPPDLKESAKFKDDLAPQSNDEKLAPRLDAQSELCLLYTSPSPRDGLLSRMPSSA